MVREVINYPLSLVKLLIVDEDDQQFLQHKFGNAEFCSWCSQRRIRRIRDAWVETVRVTQRPVLQQIRARRGHSLSEHFEILKSFRENVPPVSRGGWRKDQPQKLPKSIQNKFGFRSLIPFNLSSPEYSGWTYTLDKIWATSTLTADPGTQARADYFTATGNINNIQIIHSYYDIVNDTLNISGHTNLVQLPWSVWMQAIAKRSILKDHKKEHASNTFDKYIFLKQKY